MSTLKVSSINNAAASSGGLAIDSSGVVTGGLPYPNRNLLYNGAMQVAQRGTSATGLTNSISYATADRWGIGGGTGVGVWTQTVENEAPTGSGLRKSLKMLCTTSATPSASSELGIQQVLEGQDLQRIAKGTSSAQPLTLSFWVKSNVTGTYAIWLYDADNTRHFSTSYTVSTSNTWEKKTIAVPADTTGVFDNDNAGSLYMRFYLVAGSNYTSGSLQNTWASLVDANRAVGQTNLAAAVNNYWQITGVQLEAGPVATPFEFKSYGQELRECQRYYQEIARGVGVYIGTGSHYSTTSFDVTIRFPSMRTGPSLYSTSGTDYYGIERAGATDGCDAISLGAATPVSAVLVFSGNVSGTGGWAGNGKTVSAAALLALNAEL